MTIQLHTASLLTFPIPCSCPSSFLVLFFLFLFSVSLERSRFGKQRVVALGGHEGLSGNQGQHVNELPLPAASSLAGVSLLFAVAAALQPAHQRLLTTAVLLLMLRVGVTITPSKEWRDDTCERLKKDRPACIGYTVSYKTNVRTRLQLPTY